MQFAKELCEGAGLHVELQEGHAGDLLEMNLVARYSKEKPSAEFLLQTHLDTVDPGPYSLWTKTGANPFNASIYQDEIFGLGTADVKLDFLCKLWALKSFKETTGWRLPPVLVGTYGEEQGMMGMLRLIRQNKLNAKLALVGEPTDLRLVHAAKGFAVVEISIPFSEEEIQYRIEHNLRESTSTQSRIFIGKAAHSSTPHLGESAILKVLSYLLQLPDGLAVMEIDGGVNYNTVPSHAMIELDIVGELKNTIVKKIAHIYKAILELEKDFLNYGDPAYVPAHPTLNIGIVRTHQDHVVFSGSCRIPPVVTNEVYENWMKRLREVCEEVDSTFRVSDYKRPYKTNLESEFVKVCQNIMSEMDLDQTCIGRSSTNEASILTRLGVECLSFGAGLQEGNAHTPSEHVKISDLQKAIEFYTKAIKRMCL